MGQVVIASDAVLDAARRKRAMTIAAAEPLTGDAEELKTDLVRSLS
jgi:hypothetical protein